MWANFVQPSKVSLTPLCFLSAHTILSSRRCNELGNVNYTFVFSSVTLTRSLPGVTQIWRTNFHERPKSRKCDGDNSSFHDHVSKLSLFYVITFKKYLKNISRAGEVIKLIIKYFNCPIVNVNGAPTHVFHVVTCLCRLSARNLITWSRNCTRRTILPRQLAKKIKSVPTNRRTKC